MKKEKGKIGSKLSATVIFGTKITEVAKASDFYEVIVLDSSGNLKKE